MYEGIMWGRTNLWTFTIAHMSRRDSPLSIGAKIKLIASVVMEKNASKFQDYENILVFFFFMNIEAQVVQY